MILQFSIFFDAITLILEKTKHRYYDDKNQFINDILTIGASIKDQRSGTKTIDLFDKLYESIEEELTLMTACEICYSYENQYPDLWMEYVCENPHTVIWCKYGEWPFWPAKVLTNENGFVSVRFFGKEHEYGKVSIDNCLLYSKVMPNNKETINADLHRAIQVVLFSIVF